MGNNKCYNDVKIGNDDMIDTKCNFCPKPLESDIRWITLKQAKLSTLNSWRVV